MDLSPEDVDEMIKEIGIQIVAGSCTWERAGTFQGKDIQSRLTLCLWLAIQKYSQKPGRP